MDGAQPQALFLADSDDEDVLKVPRHDVPPVIDIDIDAIFADAEDDQDDLFTFKPLAPALDTEALRREAESRHRNNVPDLTPHAILPSSSPPRDTEADQTARSKQSGGEKDAKKERRKPARLDEGRLLGPNGFPLLIKNTKNFKIKGKGHEVPFNHLSAASLLLITCRLRI
jgi:replication fork protection complex subunit Csm3/Swi3